MKKPFRSELREGPRPFRPGILLESMMVTAWAPPGGEKVATELRVVLFSQRDESLRSIMPVASRERADQLIEAIEEMRDRVWPSQAAGQERK